MATLGDRVGRYVFISSHAVYRADVGPNADEDAPRRAPVRHTEVLDNETYGPCKVACEDDVQAHFGARATIVRPGKVAGPHDPSDSFTYWVRRASRGGRVVVPGDPKQPVQIIDVRDLARLVVQLLHDDRSGVFNAVGPAEPTTLGGLIETCAREGCMGARMGKGPGSPSTKAARNSASRMRSLDGESRGPAMRWSLSSFR